MIISHISCLPHNPGSEMENQLLYEFERNQDDAVRFSLREYKARKYLDLRIFYHPKEGEEMLPTKKGITIALELLPELRKGIQACEKKLGNFSK